MAKIFAYVAILACAVFGVSAQDQQCVDVNLYEKSRDFDAVNRVIDLAAPSAKTALSKYDPLVIEKKEIDPINFKILHLPFELTPTIEKLTVSGVSGVIPRNVNVTSPTNFMVAVDFDGEVKVDATFQLQLKQLNKKWYNICWTDLFGPSECPPAVVGVDVKLGLLKPHVDALAKLAMVQCPESPTGKCVDFTLGDVIVSGILSDFDDIINQFLYRTKEAALEDFNFRFDQVTDLGIHFHSSGKLVTELGKKIFDFNMDTINKKGGTYQLIVNQIDKAVKKIAKKVIAQQYASKFQAKCFAA